MKIPAAAVLVVTFLIALGTWASAQFVPERRVDPPIVVSGADMGFRVEAYRGGTAVGQLVVRIGGQWVDADLRGSLTRKATQ